MNDKKTEESASPRSAHRLPWWLYVMLAIGCYCMLKYVVPGLHPSNPSIIKLANAAPTFAPPVTILFLLLAAKRLYDADRGKKETDQTDSKNTENPQE